jgi:predicted Zn-dependent protease
MLTREQAQQLTAKVLKFSTFPDCTVSLSEEEVAYVRFANNGLTTSAFTVERTVTVNSIREGKSGASSTTDLSDDALKATVQRSEEIAGFAPANPEYMEPLGPQKYADHDNFDEATARARSAQLIPHVKSIIEGASAKKLIAAGYFERLAFVSSFINKRGNFGYERGTDSRLTTTIRNNDGTSSGWAGQPSVRIGEINGADLGARAIDKCLRWSVKPIRLEPGKYTVVLEPTAVGDIVAHLANQLGARAAEQGQSFLSKKGGGTLVGEKLFPDIITVRTDPFDRRYRTSLWSNDGVPAEPMTWIEKGIVKNVVYDRYWASKTGKKHTPAASSFILEGASPSVADLIKATERGLLVTRFWYIRSVNLQTVQYTGLTRDGLFLIENGQVTRPVVNLRFTESIVRLLQNTTMLSQNTRVRGAEVGMIAPAIQARDFTFTSVSDAV